MRDKPRWEIIHGDSLTVLESFPPGTFDAVITDPPYASGGRTQAEKSKATAKKYSSMGGNAPPDFDGDAKDQRSWTRWAAEWLYLARRAAKPGAPVCMFIDWRQLPCASDALQWAGWIWRGIAVWDKAIDQALAESHEQGIHGKETTPFLLARVAELTGGDSLESNIQLVLNNARVAAKTAVALCK